MKFGLWWVCWLVIGLAAQSRSAGQGVEAGDLLIADAGSGRVLQFDASTGSVLEVLNAGDLAAANGGIAVDLSGEILYDNHQSYLYFSGTAGKQRLYRADVGQGVVGMIDSDTLAGIRGVPPATAIEISGKEVTDGGMLFYADRSAGGAILGLELRTGIHTVHATAADLLTIESVDGLSMASLDFSSFAYDPVSESHLLLVGGGSEDALGNLRPALYRTGSGLELTPGPVGCSWEQVLPAPAGSAYVLETAPAGTSLIKLDGATRSVLLGAADLVGMFGAGVEVAPAMAADSGGLLYLLSRAGTVIRIDPEATDVAASALEVVAASDHTADTGAATTGAIGIACVAAAPVSCQVTESSSPQGHVADAVSQMVRDRYYTVSNPPITSGNLRLGFWTVNGVRASSGSGRGLLRPTIQVTEDVEVVAQYFETGVDGDGDRLDDWWELWMFGVRTWGPQDNKDGDMFSHEDEFTYGYDATLIDIAMPGGIAARPSAPVKFLRANGYRYVIKGAPCGMLDEVSGTQASGSTLSTPYLNGQKLGHTFVGWEADGVRLASADGVFIQEWTGQPAGDIELVARYILTSEDADDDGLPDWYEHQYFGDLSHDGASDPDGDGHDIETERLLGFSPVQVDEVRAGGVAGRASPPTTFAIGKSLFTVESIPLGLLAQSSEYVDDGVTRTTDYLGPGSYSGMSFGYWSVNGVRMVDANGVARRQVSLSVVGATVVRAHFFLPSTDTDGDGIADVTEWQQYGNLGFDRDGDPDGDGSAIGLELDLGYSPVLVDTLDSGGIAARATSPVVFNNNSRMRCRFRSEPYGLANASTEYLVAGTTVSSAAFSHTSSFSGFRFTHYTRNGVRVVDEAGVARRQVVFEISEDTDLVAHFSLIGLDSDGDGIDDYIELRLADGIGDLDGASDPDGDGLTLAEEAAWGMNLVVPNHQFSGGIASRRSYLRTVVLNVPPSGIGLTWDIIPVGRPVGTEVGVLITTGGNPDLPLTYQLVAGDGDSDNGKFTIQGDRLLSAVVLDAPGELSVRIRTSDTNGNSHDQALVVRAVSTMFETYADFVGHHFSAGEAADPLISGAGIDNDGDGLVNLQEYVHGLDPFTPNGSPFQFVGITHAGSRTMTFAFDWRFGMTDASYRIERLFDLDSGWSVVPHQLVAAQPVGEVGRITVSVELPAPNPGREFFRLSIGVVP